MLNGSGEVKLNRFITENSVLLKGDLVYLTSMKGSMPELIMELQGKGGAANSKKSMENREQQ